jgi:hypothetical protein
MEGKVRNDGEFQSHFRLFGSSVWILKMTLDKNTNKKKTKKNYSL